MFNVNDPEVAKALIVVIEAAETLSEHDSEHEAEIIGAAKLLRDALAPEIAVKINDRFHEIRADDF